jgi:hypothetical protein
VDFSLVNQACLSVFGQAFTFVPSEGEPLGMSGIIDIGVQPEGYPPGDGSTYARLWIAASDTVPVKGDEIDSDNTAYKVLDVQRDSASGIWLLLRKDRDLE